VCAAQGDAALLQLLSAAAVRPDDGRAFERLLQQALDGLRRRGASLQTLLQAAPAEAAEARIAAERALHRAQQAATDPALDAGARSQALRLLSHGDLPTLLTVADGVLAPQQPPEVQSAAARALGGFSGDAEQESQLADWMIARWSAASPGVRGELLDGLLHSPLRARRLLEAIRAGVVRQNELSAERRQQLRLHPDPALRQFAAELLDVVSADRAALIARYEPMLASGDALRGPEVFRRTCRACHKAGADGAAVGPPLASVRNKSPGDLLLALLDPNRESLPQYLSHVVIDDSGRVSTGLIVQDSPEAVVLRRAEGQEVIIPRGQIETLQSTGQSLMPVGLEADVTPQDAADVIAWIRGLPPE
jgi:putative heme-binding domain-containing protein